MLKKVHETENLSARNAGIQSKTYVWAEVFFLTCDQAFYVCLFSSVRGGLDPITIQSNHLLGNPPYTLTKRLLGNLTDLRFAFGFCLTFKSGFEYVCINAPINVKPEGGGGLPVHWEFDSESLPLSGDFDISRCPRVGNLTCPPSWKTERTWNKSSTIKPTYLTINLVLKLFVFHLSLFLFPYNTLFLNHNNL